MTTKFIMEDLQSFKHNLFTQATGPQSPQPTVPARKGQKSNDVKQLLLGSPVHIANLRIKAHG